MALKDDIKLGFEKSTVLTKTVDKKVGDITTLTTTVKTSAVAAINSLQSSTSESLTLMNGILQDTKDTAEEALQKANQALEDEPSMNFVNAIEAEWAKP